MFWRLFLALAAFVVTALAVTVAIRDPRLAWIAANAVVAMIAVALFLIDKSEGPTIPFVLLGLSILALSATDFFAPILI